MSRSQLIAVEVAVFVTSVTSQTTVEWEDPIFECWYFVCNSSIHDCNLSNLQQSDFGADHNDYYETTCTPGNGSEACFLSKTTDPVDGSITYRGGCTDVCDNAYHAGDTVAVANETVHYTCCFDVEGCNNEASLFDDVDEFVDDDEDEESKAGTYSAAAIGSVIGSCSLFLVGYQMYTRCSTGKNSVAPAPT